MKAMIFAAGLGTRLKPFTDTKPKALLPLAGKTLLQWQIEKLKAVGITDIVVNVHHFGEQIIDYLQVNNGFGCNVRISDERGQLLETGGGLLYAFDNGNMQTEPVLVCNVDILSNINLVDLIAAHVNSPKLLATVVVSERETQRYLLFDWNGELCGWTNKNTGEVKPEVLQLMKTTKECLYLGIEQAVTGKRLGDLGYAIQQHAEKAGYSVCREYVGHGIGREMHEDPEVCNYGRRGNGIVLKSGMTLAIEPMILMGRRNILIEDDGWTARTCDRKPAAHYELSVCVRNGKADILSTFDYIQQVLGDRFI
jgi:molybdopterin-guanine dinucleotide biosynthesis protein A